MQFQTLSVLAGSEACNARCPFCVSKMTPPNGIKLKEPEVNWRNFRKACILAHRSGVSTVMFTGKGEPTLFPNQITKYLRRMQEFEFPMIELQTNGITLADLPEEYDSYLREWYELGMTTIAVSVVHYNPEQNRRVYLPYKKAYINLPELIRKLHRLNLSVRLTCVLLRGFIDSVPRLEELAAFARDNKVEQLTVTPVNKPEDIRDTAVWNWTNQHHISPEQVAEIAKFLKEKASHLRTLAHGAEVYDLNGQNICLNHCLDVRPNSKEMRNLIFFPDGHLRYYWQYPGAILL